MPTRNQNSRLSPRRTYGDGLANLMTGAGTSVDKTAYRNWTERAMDEYSVDVAYRGSWLMRRVVDVPPADACRAWRDWQASNPQIEELEAEEKRLHVKQHIREGLIYGRLGGGIVIMGVQFGNPWEPLPEKLPKESLRYLRSYSRYRVKLGPLIADPMDDDFGEPEWFEVSVDPKDQNNKVKIHRSRVMVFKGRFAGHIKNDGAGYSAHPFWGESVVSVVDDAVKDSISVNREIVGLIEELKIDVFGIPDLMSQMNDPEAEARISRRLGLAQAGKSNHRALIKDALETFEQRQLNVAGFPELIAKYLSIVSAASGIPETRLLGRSPAGMNATGEGDQQNYDQMVNDIQEDDMRPAFDVLDAALIPSALGSVPDDVYWEFAPTRVMTESQAAEIEAKEAETVTKYGALGLIPDEALARSIANRMVESGRWPGLEDALDKLGEWWKEIGQPEVDPVTGQPIDPATGKPVPAPAPQAPGTGAAPSGGTGAAPKTPAPARS